MKLVHDFSPTGLECHFLILLPKMLAFVMIMSTMLISYMSIAAAPEASVMVAYSLMLWKVMAMGLVWEYVTFSTYNFLCTRDCSVMYP